VSPPEFLTVPEIAKLLRVTRARVRAEILEGRLKGLKVGALWRIRRQDFDEYVDAKLAETPTLE
jgi:excisionase family DNA binding protein